MMSRGTRVRFGEVVLAGVGERGLCELFEEGVRFAVDDAVALLDRGAADGLGEVALAGSGRTEQEGVLALGDEAGGGELVDECAVGVAEASLLVAPGKQPVLAPVEFVADEGGDEVERGHLLSLCLVQARVEQVGHAGRAGVCGVPGRVRRDI